MKKNKKITKKTVNEIKQESWDIGKIIKVILIVLLVLAIALFFVKNKGGIKLFNGNNTIITDAEKNNNNGSGNNNGNGEETKVTQEQLGNKTESGNKTKKNKKVKTPRLFQISRLETAGVQFFDKEKGAYRIKYFTTKKDGYKTKTDLYDDQIKMLKSESFRENPSAGMYDDAKWIEEGLNIFTTADEYSSKITYINNGKEVLELPKNIETLSISDDKKMFYIAKKEWRIVGTKVDFNGKIAKSIEVFTSMLSQWMSDWRGGDKVLIYPKPISNQQGVSYLVDTRKGTYKKEHKALYGLQGLISPDEKFVLYFGRKKPKGKQIMFIKNLQTNVEREIPISTFADKCVWSKNNTKIYCAFPKIIGAVGKDEPDLWYKGITKFEDKVISIDIMNGIVEPLFDPEDYGVSLDIIKPKLSINDDYLYFIDKNTLYAWAYRINPIME